MKRPANTTYDRDTFRQVKGTSTGNAVRVEVALYRQLADGCKIWLGNRFSDKRQCSQLKWLKAKGTDNWSLSIPKLPAANGAPYAYLAWSRGIDKFGNVEGFTGDNFKGFNLKK